MEDSDEKKESKGDPKETLLGPSQHGGSFNRDSFVSLYGDLCAHPEKCYSYFQMPVDTFNQLLLCVSERIQRQDTHFRRSVPPIERLMVTVRFLATGENFASLHYQFHLGKSTVAVIVRDTCRAIWDLLKADYIPHPT